MGDYGIDYPADYAEVSSFRKTPSEYSGTRSPAPYATTSIIGSTRILHNSTQNHIHFPNEHYPLANRPTYCRNVYSESYYNPKEKIHITENQLAAHDNLLALPQAPILKTTPTSSSTSRKNRLKLKPLQNIHIGVGLNTDNYNNSTSPNILQQALSSTSSTSSTTTASMPTTTSLKNNHHHQQQHQPSEEQFYIKVGETNNPTNGNDIMKWNTSQQQHQLQQEDENDYDNNMYVHNNQDCRDKNVIYAPSGNRSLISYRSPKDYSDNV
jgi:roundabout, axon guidance receptor 2